MNIFASFFFFCRSWCKTKTKMIKLDLIKYTKCVFLFWLASSVMSVSCLECMQCLLWSGLKPDVAHLHCQHWISGHGPSIRSLVDQCIVACGQCFVSQSSHNVPVELLCVIFPISLVLLWWSYAPLNKRESQSNVTAQWCPEHVWDKEGCTLIKCSISEVALWLKTLTLCPNVYRQGVQRQGCTQIKDPDIMS